jgi:DNA-binding GntR family transcriptional regulator
VLDAAAHSPHLSGVLARLADISVLYVNLSLGPGASGERRDDADDDHQRLVAAYAAKDVAAASGIAVAHLTRTIDAVRRAFLARSTASDEPRGAPHRAHTTATARVAEEQLR